MHRDVLYVEDSDLETLRVILLMSTICCLLKMQHVGVSRRGSILNGVTGRLHATLCPSSLQTVSTGGINPHDSFLTVLDVECVDNKVREV